MTAPGRSDKSLALQVTTDDPTPPYEQLRRQLAELIATGAVPAGARLPPLRQLAADLGLAVGTVARTYRELEAVGLITSRRGGGTRVVDDPTGRPAPEPQALLHTYATTYARQVRRLGISDTHALGAVSDALDSLAAQTN